MWLCNNHPNSYYARGPLFKLSDLKVETANFYRLRLGKREGQTVWVVDGARVEMDVFPDFLYGGNDQRYRFNPPGDVWIDNRCGVQELEYTIRHELLERDHMLTGGWTYDRAHNAALDMEKGLRSDALSKVERQRQRILRTQDNWIGKRGTVTPDLFGMAYKMYYGKHKGLNVWIVDGSFVRQFIEPDFSYGGSDLSWPFIPHREVWLESSLNAEHAHYVLLHAEVERRMRENGARHKRAVGEAYVARSYEYMRQRELCLAHELNLAPVRFGVREKGKKSLLEGR